MIPALADASPSCFWLDRPDRPEPRPGLECDDEADLAIVGGGYTGLGAALMALEDDPGRDVVLLEADRIGAGASGRNGGFADHSLTHGLNNGLDHFPEDVESLLSLGRANLEALLASLERHGIDAHYEDTGKLDVATDECWLQPLREDFEVLARFGEEPVWLDREAVRAELDSPTYCAGVYRRAGGLVDPARLAWGLAGAAHRCGARIHEQTPVLDLRRSREGVLLRTPHGRLRARRVLLATNAFRSPLRRMRLAVIPVWDYALMTEPLSAERMAAIGWRRRVGVGDVANQFHYYRLTADDRILWGGYDAIYHYGSSTASDKAQRPESFEKLARHFFETFPQLEGLRFTHCWGGPIATTTRFCMDTGAAWGGRVAWSVGYTGLGVVASRFGAQVALDRLAARDAPHLRLALTRSRPVPWPPEPLRYLAVQLTIRELARADRNGGRRGLWLRTLDRLGLGYDS